MKAQVIRILDVIAIGPAMGWAGIKLHQETDHKLLGITMQVLGAATIGYNLANYLKVERETKRSERMK